MANPIFSLEEETRKKEIIQTSLRIVDEYGVKGLTVAKIAKEVGFAESALYRHFRSKREIIELILNDALLVAQSHFVSIKDSASGPKDQLRMLMRIHLAFLESFPGLFRIIYSDEIHLGESFLLERLNNLINEIVMSIEEMVVQGKKKGIFKKNIDVSIAGVHFLGIVQTAFSYWSFKKKRETSLIQVGERLLSQFFSGIEA